MAYVTWIELHRRHPRADQRGVFGKIAINIAAA